MRHREGLRSQRPEPLPQRAVHVSDARRAVVVDSKNWLFFGSEEGTEASLILMSLVQPCREHRIRPLI